MNSTFAKQVMSAIDGYKILDEFFDPIRMLAESTLRYCEHGDFAKILEKFIAGNLVIDSDWFHVGNYGKFSPLYSALFEVMKTYSTLIKSNPDEDMLEDDYRHFFKSACIYISMLYSGIFPSVKLDSSLLFKNAPPAVTVKEEPEVELYPLAE
jgi:hypothetical protein